MALFNSAVLLAIYIVDRENSALKCRSTTTQASSVTVTQKDTSTIAKTVESDMPRGPFYLVSCSYINKNLLLKNIALISL